MLTKSAEDIRQQSPDMIIHYMKKTLYLDLGRRDLSDLKRVCRSLDIHKEKLEKIEKKYSKSRYVLSDFWNSYFKSKKAESNRLMRRNSLPQTLIDNQEMRVHSRSENHSLMTLEMESRKGSFGLNNSLIISMKIREELKSVQSEMPYSERDIREVGHHTINPKERELFSSSNSKPLPSESSEHPSEALHLKFEKKTRVSSEKDQGLDDPEPEDFIERNSNLAQMKPALPKKKKKKKFVSFANDEEKSQEKLTGEKVLKRFRTSQSAKTSPQKKKKVPLSKTILPAHAFIKKKRMKSARKLKK